MAQDELINAMQTIPWLQDLSSEHFEMLVGISTLVEFDANQELFREGDPVDFLYIVSQGRIAIEMYVPSRGRARIFTAEPMDAVGWSSITPIVRRRTAGAKAALPSSLVKIDTVKLRQYCEDDCGFGYIIMRQMTNVVASRLLTTRLQLLDMFGDPDRKAGTHG